MVESLSGRRYYENEISVPRLSPDCTVNPAPDDDPSRARREFIARFFEEQDAANCGGRHIARYDLIKFLKEHGMPLGELEDDTLHRILIIGGQVQFIRQVRDLLSETENFKVETALSGFEAGIQAEAFHPHVIIIDFDIGFDEAVMIVQNLRLSTNYAATMIVGLANEVIQTSTKIIAQGFSEIMVKPVNVIHLCQRIRAHFDTMK